MEYDVIKHICQGGRVGNEVIKHICLGGKVGNAALIYGTSLNSIMRRMGNHIGG